MKLADLRKIAVKKHLRIRFGIAGGLECVMNDQGVAQVPALRKVPTFNLEDELAGAQAFIVEFPGSPKDGKTKERNYSRAEMQAFAAAGSGTEGTPEEHED